MWRTLRTLLTLLMLTVALGAKAETAYIPSGGGGLVRFDQSYDVFFIDEDGDGEFDYGQEPLLSDFVDEVANPPVGIANSYGSSEMDIFRVYRLDADAVPPDNINRITNWWRFDDSMNSSSQGGAYPPKATGEACPDGGTYPNCTTAKNHLSGSHLYIAKQAEGEFGVEDSEVTCTGPGDCIVYQSNLYAIGPASSNGDEGASVFRGWVFDNPRDQMTGTLSETLTHSQTNFELDTAITLGNQGVLGLDYMGRNGLIVFNDAGNAQRVRLTGAAGAGGLLDYDNATGTWQVRTAAELPSGLGNADADTDHTGYCFAADKASRYTTSALTELPNWLLITHGPGDAGCGGTCAADEFETYSPYSGQDRHAPLEYVPGASHPDFATGAADDDATIAPCELLQHVEVAINTETGRPTSAATYPMHFAATTTRATSIASGTDWEYASLGPPGQMYVYKAIMHTQHCAGATCFGFFGRADAAANDDNGTIEAMYGSQSGVADATSDVSLERPILNSLVNQQGPVALGALVYKPWVGAGNDFPELAATVYTEIDATDWNTADADLVELVRLQEQSGAQSLVLSGDTTTDRFEVAIDGATPLPLPRLVGSGSSALATGAIASTACAAAVTTAVTGVVTTDVVDWSANADLSGVTGYAPAVGGALIVYVYPTAGNVNIKVCNPTTLSITPGAVTLNWQVTR